MGCGGRRQRQARSVFAGRLSVSGHGAQDDRCCGVRQNRVVLASVADVKLPVANWIQPDRSAIKPAAMEAKGIRLQGELGISRQTIAQGMPACPGCTCMLVCASLYTIAHETAGAASTRHSLLPLRRDKVHASLGRKSRREKARSCLRTLTQTNSLCPAKNRASVRQPAASQASFFGTYFPSTHL